MLRCRPGGAFSVLAGNPELKPRTIGLRLDEAASVPMLTKTAKAEICSRNIALPAVTTPQFISLVISSKTSLRLNAVLLWWPGPGVERHQPRAVLKFTR
jgi:hypothetical protein